MIEKISDEEFEARMKKREGRSLESLTQLDQNLLYLAEFNVDRFSWPGVPSSYAQHPLENCLKNGADPNAKDPYGRTALHLATSRNCLRTLLMGHADHTILNNEGLAPIEYHKVHGNVEAVADLEEALDLIPEEIPGNLAPTPPLRKILGLLNMGKNSLKQG